MFIELFLLVCAFLACAFLIMFSYATFESFVWEYVKRREWFNAFLGTLITAFVVLFSCAAMEWIYYHLPK